MKFSRQREFVYETVKQSRLHPTADQVYHEVRKKEPNISLATVYRNLNQLAEHGSIRRISVPDGSDHYDGRLDNHEHMICKSCGRVEDIELDRLEPVMVQISRAMNNRITGYDLTLYGLCEQCAGNKLSQNRSIEQ